MEKKGIIVMGVSAAGKTTTAELLATKLKGSVCKDADDFHSEQNKKKMASGTPLTDEDRYPWLNSISREFQQFVHNTIFLESSILIITCSALKQQYRNMLQDNIPISQLQFIYLKGSKEVLKQRITARQNHFMKANMLDSQFATLEEPTSEERNVLIVPTDHKSLEEVVQAIIENPSFIGHDLLL